MTSSLQTLAMTDKQRADLAADLEASIGAGATRNRQILADQARAAVSILAFGFAVVAEDAFPGTQRSESKGWGFILALLISLAVAITETAQKANVASGMFLRAGSLMQ